MLILCTNQSVGGAKVHLSGGTFQIATSLIFGFSGVKHDNSLCNDGANNGALNLFEKTN